jgi:hypothetical protein
MKALMAGLAVCVFAVAGCRTSNYPTHEKLGGAEWNALTKRVSAVRDEERRAQQKFADAQVRLRDMSGAHGGALEKDNHQLVADYNDARGHVTAVHNRITDAEATARDSFVRWEEENRHIATESLRDASQEQLHEARARYERTIAASKRAEERMDPVLAELHDYLLAVKYTVNPNAVAAVNADSERIQSNINRLLNDLNVAIARADDFVHVGGQVALNY